MPIKWEDKQEAVSQNLSVRLDREDYDKVKEIAEKQNMRVGTVVREIVKYYFKNIE